MTAFSRDIEQFLAESFELDPLRATAAGMHAHDARWPDVTEAGRLRRLEFGDRWDRRLAAHVDATLTPDERIDRDLLRMELAAERFAESTLREDAWDPLSWVYLLGEGIFPLLAREFAPLDVRLTSVAGRLEGIPGIVAAARTALRGHGQRAVSQFHTETAIRQLAGIVELVADAFAQAEAASGDPAVAALRSSPSRRGGGRDGGARGLRGRVPGTRSCRDRSGRAASAPSSSRRSCATRS